MSVRLSVKQINQTAPQRVLCLNPMGCGSEIWISSMEQMSEQYEILLMDYPGFSSSEFLETQTVEELTQLVSHTLMQLPTKPLHMIGYSFGSWIAQNLVFDERLDLRSLTVMGSSDRIYNQGILMADEWENIIRNMGIDSFLAQLAFWSFCTQTFEAGSFILRSFVRGCKKSCKDPEVFLNQLQMVKSYQQGVPLSEIKVPTLIIRGEFDCLYPAFCSELLHKEIPNSQLCTVPRAGHAALWENPSFVSKEIEQFVQVNG
ncbi:alpha/beta fold hydrolase [Hazenella coriacea]|uniref:Pimeloyl-ACP methyl ester carboxylesterase n=1 Tax=Hazenella coriacea TaxID=1179467 RepID=A0A4R3L830_9BACL|nr:alpha/beta hydrolase [Hazenella coriacea]TCS95799.1 pimeloyl-ACP methyl ester carboxylesterase [Hazenella coriacea]